MLKAALVILAVIVLIVIVVTIVGYSLPKAHVAARDTVFPRPPDDVFAALRDVQNYPAWRSDVKRVELLPQTATVNWREHGSNDTITFEFQELEPPRRIVSRITDPSLPFGGSWTYLLTPEPGGTRLSITEHGEVYNPLFRFMSRFVFGHTATLDRFLADLTRHLSRK